MKLLVGLGNPGAKYLNHRHNVGHQFIDYIIDVLSGFSGFSGLTRSIINSEIKPLKTSVFMNQSGLEIGKFIRKLNIRKFENLFIAHDDLDIPLGKFKIQFGEGPKLHNGIASIEKALGAKTFWRIRVGIDSRTPENWIAGEPYVLSDFSPQEKALLEREVFPKIWDRLSTNLL